jgi:glycine cleavage system H protein
MFYTESHEWIDGLEGVASVGVTEFAQDELGDIVYVELPKVGAFVEAGEELAVLESTKAAADVYAPVCGEVVEVNVRLKEDPGLINRSPQKEGWIVKLSVKDEGENLLDEKGYQGRISN